MNWKKFNVVFVATAAALVLSGCGGDSSPQACAYGVQKNLDKGNYLEVINELNNSSSNCYEVFTTEEARNNLGAAYLGEAGLDVSGLIGLYSDINLTAIMDVVGGGLDPADLNASSIEVLTDTINALTAHLGKDGSHYLDLAGATYLSIVDDAGVDCSGEYDAKYTVACSLKDLNGTGEQLQEMVDQAASLTALTTSLGDDLDVFMDAFSFDTNNTVNTADVNDNNQSDRFEVLTCAFAEANKTDGNCSEPTITYVNLPDVTFIATNNSFIYGVKVFDVNDTNGDDGGDRNYTKLIGFDGFIFSPATTKGFCHTDFSSCLATDLSATPKCYPCPVVDDEENTTSSSADGLLMIANSDDPTLIEALLPSDVNLSAYEQNATESNSTPLVAYIRAEANLTGTGELTSEEIANLLDLLNQ